MSIFKAYDIRGKVPSELDEDIAYKFGRAFVTFLSCKEVCVGQDARKSSPKLYQALVKGITEQGANVINIGLCSTPLFYFATHNYSAGIMVTASHNPAEYNGFKLCRNGTVPISGDTGIKEIETLVAKNKFKPAAKKGIITKHDYFKEFLDFCLKHKGNIKPMKIVVDTANGMGGYVLPEFFKQLPQLEVIPLFWSIDMSFPNHEANPLKPENMIDLQNAVKTHKADLGIAIDGDADRIMFVDEKAQLICSDFIGAMIGLEFINLNINLNKQMSQQANKQINEQILKQKHPEKKLTLGYDIRCSNIVKEVWENAGAKTIVTKVGHALIKETMRKEKIFFVGEFSGHFYYEETDYTENTSLTMLQVLNIISEKDKPLSELIKPFRKYHQSGEINFEVHDKIGKMKELETLYKKSAKEINWLDGITVKFNGWWFNVRPSNTDPVLRLNVEANTKKQLEEKLEEVKKVIVR